MKDKFIEFLGPQRDPHRNPLRVRSQYLSGKSIQNIFGVYDVVIMPGWHFDVYIKDGIDWLVVKDSLEELAYTNWRHGMEFHDKVSMWKAWIANGNHKAFEEDILDLYDNTDTPMPEGVDICVYQKKPYTHAILDLSGIFGYVESGYAKWDNTGEWDEEFGARMCVKRAARDIFRTLQEKVVA